jgi:copper chaperone CopZ
MAFRAILAALVIVPSALAEFRHVSMDFSGEECSSCSASMTKSLQRLRGVTSVSVDVRKAVITIELAAGNRVPLSEIRDSIKRVGFTPGEARVLVRGTIAGEKEQRILKPHGLEQAMQLAGAVSSGDGEVELEGTIPPANSPSRDTLIVKNSLSR